MFFFRLIQGQFEQWLQRRQNRVIAREAAKILRPKSVASKRRTIGD
jgi:hypothetical protein